VSSDIIYLIYSRSVSMDWTEKYRPSRLADIVGNSTAVRQLHEWARGWKPGHKPLILYGHPGIGKTSASYALARDMNWEVLELNASDQRTKAVIEKVAGAGSTSGSLTGAGRRLIILDEADNLQGNADKGGAKAILDIIRDARQPIILIANDLYGLASELRSACEPVQFRALPARSIAPHLKSICVREKVSCGDLALKDIAESAAGDMRAAVNMLYASAIGREEVREADVHTAMKDERASIFQLITAVFSSGQGTDTVRLSYEIDETPDSIEQWIEANLPAIKNPASRACAYRYLSRADEYIGNTYRQQYYTLWRYASVNMLLGTGIAAGGHGIHERINSPRRWQRMASSRKQKAVRASLMAKLSGTMHMPRHAVQEGYLNLLSFMAERDPYLYAKELDLDADQLTLLIHDRVKASAVVKKIASERKESEKIEKIKAVKKTAQPKPAKKAGPSPGDAEQELAGTEEKEPLPLPAGSPSVTEPGKEESSQKKDPKSGGRQSTLF
jgi:replication factor C large subunit